MSLTRPTHRGPQTLAQAKAEYKKYGPRLSSQEQRQLDRGAELYRRAEKIREGDKRRRENARRKSEKEQREREARRRMGIASQKPYVSQHQRLLEGFVEAVRVGGGEMEAKGVVGKEEDMAVGKEDGLMDEVECMKDVEEDVAKKEEGACEKKEGVFMKKEGLVELEEGVIEQKGDVIEKEERAEKKDEEPWAEDDLDDGALLNALFETVTEEPIELTAAITTRKMIREQDTRIQEDRLFNHNPASPAPGDSWDDFLVSNTQLEREMALTPPKPTAKSPPEPTPQISIPAVEPLLALLSTQDVTFSAEDLEELGTTPLPVGTRGNGARDRDVWLMPPPRCRPNREAIEGCLPTFQFAASDFDLSTQDLREIGC